MKKPRSLSAVGLFTAQANHQAVRAPVTKCTINEITASTSNR